MKGFFQFALEVAKVVLIALVIVVPLRFLVFQPFLVRGNSMEPNYHNGDYLIVDQLSYRFESPERGDVIVFKFPFDPSQRFIKRIVGLPGETVEVKDGKVVVYGRDGEIKDAYVLDESSYLPPGLETSGSLRIDVRAREYFVLGDNRPSSSDSRKWGVVEEGLIVGKVFLNVFSVNAFAKEIIPQEGY
ncbi:MAG: signal peptidase I [Candidatus Wildermuthbacteria bacterium RIFCSPHIGHO2_02_FULL_49_9]|uniref:Signal peptidase I n=1 Tax=Candidatus Wildermuthbacteria bacterium RIFCSPHIGHO2_02_FULL_49_9 TaxID=1802456 RepID=A0A1G2RED5_9BACT|nr:MAG: signal peptidase I [Candidatus Wildermuthbacteria bacterium RIFCSPHIGHO2_02_FULL_49_9]